MLDEGVALTRETTSDPTKAGSPAQPKNWSGAIGLRPPEIAVALVSFAGRLCLGRREAVATAVFGRD
jgi:hypothetical protein